jgi:hypothetical protein
MKISTVLIWLLLFGTVFGGIIAYYSVANSQPVEFRPFELNTTEEVVVSEEQFFPNMRFPRKDIGYLIENRCNANKVEHVQEAFTILADKTILTFYPVDGEIVKPEITITCSNLAPKLDQSRNYIAGEGGPTKIVNATSYSVILEGEISLFRDEKCPTPQIALHEILHTLGFDHNNNKRSVLYPTSGCNQALDQYIIDSIDELYEEDGAPDLVIDRANADLKGRYLSFDLNVSNIGLVPSLDSIVHIYSEDKEIGNYSLGNMGVGVKKSLQIKNLKISRGLKSVAFEIKSDFGKELSLENNRVELNVDK